jgi:uncharacterized membrane protein
MGNNNHIVSEAFDSRMEAEQCITELRRSGVPDDAISIVARNEGEIDTTHPDGSNAERHSDNAGTGAAKGALAGGTVGALFGLAAFLIPGVGPIITAGALASTLGFAGGAAVSGAIVGATAGGIAGLLMNYGVSEEDAHAYEQRLNRGGVVVMVDTRKAPNAPAVYQILGPTHAGSRRY